MLLAIPSNGLHTNGYSLARKVFFEERGLGTADSLPSDPSRTVGEALLATHRSYRPSLSGLLAHPALHALAHITGGGMTDNLPRVLPTGLHAAIKIGRWEIPAVFEDLKNLGAIGVEEMFRVFNMGVGFCVVVDSQEVDSALTVIAAAGGSAQAIGEVVEDSQRRVYLDQHGLVGQSGHFVRQSA